MSLGRLVHLCRVLRDAGWTKEQRREWLEWRAGLAKRAKKRSKERSAA